MGMITMNASFSPLFTGTGSVCIYFFPNNIWGVDGRINLRILNFLTCNAEFFIGNPGFYVSMSQQVNFDIWLLRVQAGMGITIWKFRNASWGAYGFAYINASLRGINITTLGFKAAMINNNNSLVYGEAYWETWIYDFKFWGAIYNGSTDGGWGNNENYMRQINDAITQASNMRNQKDEALRQLNNR
jgi:hypothetical protein